MALDGEDPVEKLYYAALLSKEFKESAFLFYFTLHLPLRWFSFVVTAWKEMSQWVGALDLD